VEVKRIVDPDQIDGFLDVIKSAWKAESVDGAFRDTIASMRYHGGLLLGAFDDDGKIIGMSFGYPGFRNGKLYLYSHMAGVVENKKYSNVGYSLKMKQRDLAASMGYDLIAWTFDPFNPLNAYFNISKLGAITRTYIKNFYGVMNDGINRGMRTDRVVAEWWINLQIDRNCEIIDFLNDVDRYSEISTIHESSCLGFYVPPDISYFHKYPDLGSKLKDAAFEVFNALLSKGYAIVAYKRGKSNYFVFKRIENLGKRIFHPIVK